MYEINAAGGRLLPLALPHAQKRFAHYIPLYLLGEFFISAFSHCRAVVGYTCAHTFVQPAQVQDSAFPACPLPEEYSITFPPAVTGPV